MAERTERKSLGTVTAVKKFGLVGDGTVGKTTILLTYTTQSFVKDYVPTGVWRVGVAALRRRASFGAADAREAKIVGFFCVCVSVSVSALAVHRIARRRVDSV